MAGSNKVDRYRQLLIDLLPKGRLWSLLDQPQFNAVLAAISEEFCRVDDRVQDLLFEADPRQTNELLEDWERMLGIPDECTPDDSTEIERREQVVQKLTNIGGISNSFYEFLISQLGFTATVTDYQQFRVGKSVVGDALNNDFDDFFVVGDTVGSSLHNWGWLFYFNVDLPSTAAEFFEVGSSVVGDPLAEYSNDLIECTIKRLKPAHTGVTFTFNS